MEQYNELWRLSTLEVLDSLGPVCPKRLAQSGFFYDQITKDIRCYSCGVVWKMSDKRVALCHLTQSPNCRHANFGDKRNISTSDYCLLDTSGNNIHEKGEKTQQVLDSPSASEDNRSLQRHASKHLDEDVGVLKCTYKDYEKEIISGSTDHKTPADLDNNGRPEVEKMTCDCRSSQSGQKTVTASGNDPEPTGRGSSSSDEHKNDHKDSRRSSSHESTDDLNGSAISKRTEPHEYASIGKNQPRNATVLVPSGVRNHEPDVKYSSTDSQLSVSQNRNADTGRKSKADDPDVSSVLDSRRAASLHYAKRETRLKSFEDWPRSSGARPQGLAEAGFYYAGIQESRSAKQTTDCKPTREPSECRSANPSHTELSSQQFPREIPTAVSSLHCSSRTMSTSCPLDGEDAESYSQKRQEEKRQLEDLREKASCKVCLRGTIDTIFLPCGHLATCHMCATMMRRCCVCYEKIRGTAHVYTE